MSSKIHYSLSPFLFPESEMAKKNPGVKKRDNQLESRKVLVRTHEPVVEEEEFPSMYSYCTGNAINEQTRILTNKTCRDLSLTNNVNNASLLLPSSNNALFFQHHIYGCARNIALLGRSVSPASPLLLHIRAVIQREKRKRLDLFLRKGERNERPLIATIGCSPHSLCLLLHWASSAGYTERQSNNWSEKYCVNAYVLVMGLDSSHFDSARLGSNWEMSQMPRTQTLPGVRFECSNPALSESMLRM